MRFEAKLLGADNRITSIHFEAPDEKEARAHALERGYAVVSIRRKGGLGWDMIGGKVAFPVTLFSIELVALLDAGLNVVEALQTLTEQETRPAYGRVLARVLEGIRRGQPLSQAMASEPDAFPPLYVATIRSSERTSSLKEALKRYVAYREEIDKVRKRVVNALLYPAILLVVGTCVIGFLLLYVVPRFAGVYEEMSAELPFYSRLLLAVGRWMQANGLLALFLALGALAVGAYALSRSQVRAALLERARRAPLLGPRMKIYQLARVYRTFAMLLRSGIPALGAFDMMRGLLTADLRPALDRAKVMVSEGRAMSSSLTAVGLATPVATRLMLVGERSGQMGELMDHIAKFYDDATARSVDAFTRVFEPLLMTAIGAGVGLVVVLMYMPIFELAGAVQ